MAIERWLITLIMVLLLVFNISYSVSLEYLKRIEKGTIARVNDINVTIKQYETYELPKTVRAIMEDKTKREVEVLWNKKLVNTKKAGTNIYLGKVNGYSRQITLKMNTIPIKHKIKDMKVMIKRDADKVEDKKICIKHEERYTLPYYLTVAMGSKKDVPFQSKVTMLKTKVLGTYSYNGNVKRYNDRADLRRATPLASDNMSR